MAPVNPNNTGRIYFDYETGSGVADRTHTFQLRGPAAPGEFVETDYQIKALDFLTAIGAGNFHVGWRVLRVRVQAAQAAFSLPVPTYPALAAFVGTNGDPWTTRDATVEATFQGRSPLSGRRVDISLYGLQIDFPVDFRIVPAVGSELAAAIAVLNSPNPAWLRTIDGSAAYWYNYVNFNQNSYWEREVRG